MNTLLLSTTLAICASSASADIYQWHDGDGDGSLWLSNSYVEPYVELSGQILWWANLPFANLHHATFVYTDLSYANLYGANLSAADMSFANLFESNLGQTDLAFTNFFGANLQSSNIEDANMFYADFSDADLSNIENWETAFWMAARYNDNTIFPIGMDPNDYAMIEIEVPVPGTLIIFCLFGVKRKRNYNRY